MKRKRAAGSTSGSWKRDRVVVEIVHAHDLVAAREQAPGDVHADEAGHAGDQNLHDWPSLKISAKRAPSQTAALPLRNGCS